MLYDAYICSCVRLSWCFPNMTAIACTVNCPALAIVCALSYFLLLDPDSSTHSGTGARTQLLVNGVIASHADKVVTQLQSSHGASNRASFDVRTHTVDTLQALR